MKNHILLAALAISLIACDSEENYIDEPVAAQVSATIENNALTRAHDNAWDTGDSIGISMGGRYVNMKYVNKGSGVFSGATMYFKNKQEAVSITAYYPFTGSEGQSPAIVAASTIAGHQSRQEQQKIDFLFTSLSEVKGAQPDIKLGFSHMMSKLTLIFKNGNDGTDVSKISSFTIEGLVHEGTFNPVTGECAAKSGVASTPLTINPSAVKNEEALPSLLIFPQSVRKLTLKVTDREDHHFTAELNLGADGMESGNNHQFTVTVKRTGLSINSSIINWMGEELESNASSADNDN